MHGGEGGGFGAWQLDTHAGQPKTMRRGSGGRGTEDSDKAIEIVCTKDQSENRTIEHGSP